MNVVLQVNTVHGSYQYWLQDVPTFLTNSDTMALEDNVWNFTSFPSLLSNQSVKGSGYVYSFSSGLNTEYFYAYGTQWFRYHLPLSGKVVIRETSESNGVLVQFGYYNGTINWYDNVTISQPGVTGAYLLVDGFNMTGSGNYYDAELVFGGEGNGEVTYFNSMNSTLGLYYLANGTTISPQELYGFGADTAEGADNVRTTLLNGVPDVVLGQENFYEPLVLPLLGKFAFHVIRAEEGLPVLVNVSVNVTGGVGPYTFLIYLDHVPIKTFSGYSLAQELDLGELSPGIHNLTIVVVDRTGDKMSGYTSITVTSGPSVVISSQTVIDSGETLTVYIHELGGTPPYTVRLLVNGTSYQVQGDKFTLSLPPGVYRIYAEITDSSGLSSTSNVLTVRVNPPLNVSLKFPSTLDVGEVRNLSVVPHGGTPPYVVRVTVNGTLITGPLNFTVPDEYLLEVRVTDQVNVSSIAKMIVTVNPDPVLKIEYYPELDVGEKENITVLVDGGSPPFTVMIYPLNPDLQVHGKHNHNAD
ncbi:thermopsin [Metallosphaera hakonensis]|uniref:thermopsin n=1 Tax=Metallosphaera hakonensis TaxID=79601 RepID=UPI0006D26AF3|nr:thermopsin [Metallosphaera hakonensis]